MLILTDTQRCDLAISVLDAKGNAATIDGIPAWSSSDESVATISPSSDGMNATVLAAGPLGTVQISVTADADLGSGTRPIAGVLDVQVIGGEAVSVGITTGTPEEQ